MWTRIKRTAGRTVANYLEKRISGYQTFGALPLDRLRAHIRPADVLLVEGDTRVSVAIKYLTTSTWSHATFFVGTDGIELIEADLRNGVHTRPLAAYDGFNLRICRPVGLTDEDRGKVIAYMRESLGKTYDLKNVIDLARYLIPKPPVPQRLRRRMLALGSGDPTRAICSTLIAQAYQSVRYPILPEILPGCPKGCVEEILHIRHHSLFAPRDFDLSPYFRVVKPTIEVGFDYRALHWGKGPAKPADAPQDDAA